MKRRPSSRYASTHHLIPVSIISERLFALLAKAQPSPGKTFAVIKTANTHDGTCDADCSRREGIAAGIGTADHRRSNQRQHRRWFADYPRRTNALVAFSIRLRRQPFGIPLGLSSSALTYKRSENASVWIRQSRSSGRLCGRPEIATHLPPQSCDTDYASDRASEAIGCHWIRIPRS